MADISMEGGRSALQRINRPLFALSGGFILLFCLYALVDLDRLSAAVDWGFAVSAKYFGLYWQILMLATFLISLVLCVLPGGQRGVDDHVHGAGWWRRVLGRRGADRAFPVPPAAVRRGAGRSSGPRQYCNGAKLSALGLFGLGDPRFAFGRHADALPL